MTITPGTRLGRYEIRSLLGTGGMSEVYLAEDVKLHRRVALKILPAEYCQDRPLLTRSTSRIRPQSPEHLRKIC